MNTEIVPDISQFLKADRAVSTDGTGQPRVSVVLPARNEAKNIVHVLAKLPPVDEVILVDGGSVDGTVAEAEAARPGIVVVRQSRDGKGNALACGFARATGDIVVALDADGSTDPAEIPRFVQALVNGADFVKGTRCGPHGGSVDLTMLRRSGNRTLGLFFNILFGTRYSDLCYGFNAFWTDCLPVFELDPSHSSFGKRQWGDGFEIEVLLNIRAARSGLRVVEVPSFEYRRIFGTSNLHAVTDGLRVLRTIVRERLRRNKVCADRHPLVLRGLRPSASGSPLRTPRKATADARSGW